MTVYSAFELRTLAFAMHDLSRDDAVTDIDDANQFKRRAGKGFHASLPLTDDRVPPHEGSPLRPTLQLAGDDNVGVERLTHGLHVPGVERREEASDHLHVLLRHRLLREA